VIDLHFWPTPNGRKVSIMLEEIGLAYRVVPVDIGRGDQFLPEFLALSPNNRMPAIVDDAPEDGGPPLSVFESGAILIYLADKAKMLLPPSTPSTERARIDVLQWVMWQMAGLGPMLGQAHHFRQYASEKIPYAIARYTDEANRLYGVLDTRLATREFIAGDYSIADIAAWPWIVSHENQGQSFADFPHVRRWFEAIEGRPAVRRGVAVGKDLRSGPMDDAAKKVLFGQRARAT
jgi:GST-like protein